MIVGRVNPQFKLEKQGINGLGVVHYNLSEPALIEQALKRDEATLSKGGTVLVTTGKFTGRSPNDKHIVATSGVEDNIWCDNNAKMPEDEFDALKSVILDHMKGRNYSVQDLIAGSDPSTQSKFA